MRHSLVISTLAIFIGLTWSAKVAAVHHGQGPKPPFSIAELERQANARFAAADTDSDGLLSKDEFTQAAPRLQPRGASWRNKGTRHRDADARVLTPEKRQAKIQQRQQRIAATNPERAAAREKTRNAVETELFQLMDTNGDGQLDQAEHGQAEKRALRRQAQQAVAFTNLDVNEDGYLSPDELPDLAKRLQRVDTNQDGIVSRREMRTGRNMLREMKN